MQPNAAAPASVIVPQISHCRIRFELMSAAVSGKSVQDHVLPPASETAPYRTPSVRFTAGCMVAPVLWHDEPRAASEREVRPGPLEHHRQAIAKAGERID